MLTEILMEALMAMDEDTLDSVLESCDAEELEIINSAVEAGRYTYDSSAIGSEINDTVLQMGTMSAKDKKDFAFINDVQRHASSKGGWASVDKKDRDKFVDIMTHTKNLAVLKKAKKLGEREADNDTKVQRALAMIGSSVAGGTAGALIGNRADTKAIKNLKDIVAAKSANADAAGKAADIAKDEWWNGIGSYDKVVSANKAQFDADTALMGANSNLNSYGHPGAIGGGAIGAIAGAGVGAAINAAKKGIKNARDLKALKAQGEDMTPDQRWKAARKRAGK